jgi:uncharacterized protein (DUF433 family)
MRIRAHDVLELLADEMTYEEILAEFPDLEKDDIRACLHYAARRLDQSRSNPKSEPPSLPRVFQ